MASRKRASKKKDDSGGLREFARESTLAELKVQHERDQRSLKAELAEVKGRYKSLLERVEEQETELNAYSHALRERAPIAPIKPRARAGTSESTLIVLASDWHVGEVVEPATVQGLNTYNPKVAKKRAEHFFRSTLKVTEMARAHTKVRDLVLALGGDFISGYIHEELMSTTAMGPLEEIDFARDLLKPGIEFLLEHGGFDRIVIPCVSGNHGRITKRRWTAREAGTNLEMLMYRRLLDDFAGEKRVSISVAESVFHEELEIYGRRLRLTHGERLKFNGGMQGFYGRLYKLALERNRIQPCFLTLCGHWHQLHQFPNLGMVNGSLIGTSPYGSQFGHEIPQQAWALIEKQHGVTAVGPLRVE